MSGHFFEMRHESQLGSTCRGDRDRLVPMEKLANLTEIRRAFGFRACLRVKIKGASAEWMRPIAIIEE